MNDDMISRAAAIDILDAYQVMVENGEENPYAWARLRMSELPSVQPEIIRCKDCKHLQKWRSEESAMEFGQIYECGKGVLRDPLPDGSCSKAERRTDG